MADTGGHAGVRVDVRLGEVQAVTGEWEHPAWAQRLQAEREARGWKKPAMGRALWKAAGEEYPPLQSLVRQIRRWEAGNHVPDQYWRAAYAKAFGITETVLFSDAPPVERRICLKGAVGAAVSLVPALSAAPIRNTLRAGDVSAVRDMIKSLTVSERQFGGDHARPHAVAFLHDVVRPRLQGHGDERTTKRFFAASAEFALRVSSMHLDAGKLAAARDYLGTATSLSFEADDPTLSAWVLARRGEQVIDEASMARAAAGHADKAVAYTGGAAAMVRTAPPLAKAFVLTKYALALSLTGDRLATARVIGQVWDAYDKAGTAEEPAWMSAYGWAHLRHEEARCHANLGDGETAVQAAEDALSERTRARPRAFSLGIQAIGYAQVGEVERACQAAHELVSIAEDLQSNRVTARVRGALDALSPYEKCAPVAHLHEAARPVLARIAG